MSGFYWLTPCKKSQYSHNQRCHTRNCRPEVSTSTATAIRNIFYTFPINRNYRKCDTAIAIQTYQKTEYDKAKQKYTKNITCFTHISSHKYYTVSKSILQITKIKLGNIKFLSNIDFWKLIFIFFLVLQDK